ncbi:MAG TPA: glucose-1-phosphate adenylyltransferase [Kiritimatiellia bacterium]|nr:glucose-1-phosphate adenylyltransferase [Kiritimatiellia bacterium]HMO97981.1 glucose-1-phosphate adenylyltransferase [Kiritimatiellia bacterium]HMP95332.1 glucose-1-phosphate adenylyltransferase [Kiritimatiellia bacterium]
MHQPGAANAVAVILGGGQGTRLLPLTRDRSKPAVPIAGKYRLIDIPVSNCINSGLRQIYVLTQFNSESLHRHIQGTYHFDAFSQGFVRILAAQQTPSSESWFQGTADAVRQSLRFFLEDEPEFVVILSGDQLYRMNFAEIIQQHIAHGAEVTICTKPVERSEAYALGIMKIDEHQRITRFVEKPGNTPLLDEFRAPIGAEERYLASMGIYVFNTKVLRDLLAGNEVDFGKHIIPGSIKTRNVYSYVYDGYWKDIGTLRSFWEANLGLTEIVPEFSFYDPKAPIYTAMRYLPPSKINRCDLNRCLLSEGCIVSGHRLLHSVVGIRAIIGDGTVIEHSVVMGADYYENAPEPGLPPLGIGRDCYIKNAIIDKNARIGDGVYLSPEGKKEGETTEIYTVQDGIIVVPKNAVIPSGTKI